MYELRRFADERRINRGYKIRDTDKEIDESTIYEAFTNEVDGYFALFEYYPQTKTPPSFLV